MTGAVVCLVGPTASGKTDLALRLAERFPVEIVNADSLQVFRRLDIGTAKPTVAQRKKVPHHIIDTLDPDAEATAAWYAKTAQEKIQSIQAKKKIPMVVGGAGFYLRALELPPQAAETEINPEPASDEDYDFIKEHDPEAAARIHPNDNYRISRATALIKKGQRPSDRWKSAAQQTPAFPTLWLGINWERAELHSRINQRVKEMFQSGLLEETAGVLQDFPRAARRLSRAIGYKQAVSLLANEIELPRAIELTQIDTRQYAKRQMTWFRKEVRIRWHAPEKAFEGMSIEIERNVQG